MLESKQSPKSTSQNSNGLRSHMPNPLIILNRKIQYCISRVVRVVKSGNPTSCSFEDEEYLKENDYIRDVVVNSKEVQDACKARIVRCISSWEDIHNIFGIMKNFGVNLDKIINSREVFNAFSNRIFDVLSMGLVKEADSLLSVIDVPEIKIETINNLMQSICEDHFVGYHGRFRANTVNLILFFMDEQNVSKETINNACKRCLISSIFDGKNRVNEFLSFIGDRGISEEEIKEMTNSEEVLNACKNGLILDLENCWTDSVSKILSIMAEHVSKETIKAIINSKEVLDACKKGLVRKLGYDRTDSVNKILSIIGKYARKEAIRTIINSQDVLNACKDSLVENLEYGRTDSASKILSFMDEHISKETIKAIINSEEVLNTCKNRLVKNLKDGWFDSANKILSFMDEHISKETIKAIINSKEVFNALKEGISRYSSRNSFGEAAKLISSIKHTYGVKIDENHMEHF